jgi:hypothetical protein
MPLNSQQKWKVEDILNQKGINKCPLCGTTPLRVQDKYYNLPLAEAGAMVGTGIRAVVASCTGCGLTLPLDAKQYGV